jgi:hypothetical protein
MLNTINQAIQRLIIKRLSKRRSSQYFWLYRGHWHKLLENHPMQVFCFKHFLNYVQLDEMVDSYCISMSYNDSQNLEFQITPISLKKNKPKSHAISF